MRAGQNEGKFFSPKVELQVSLWAMSTTLRTRSAENSRKLTLSRIYCKQAEDNILMNSMSSSLSVYQGPPVISTDGSKFAIIYIFRVGCYCVISKCGQWSEQAHTLTDLTALISCFDSSDFKHRVIIV